MSKPRIVKPEKPLDNSQQGRQVRVEAFIKSYLETGNATLAAVEAGYKKKSAYSQGHRLLKDAEVQSAIKKQMEKNEVTINKVVLELAKLGFSNIKDYLSFTESGVKLKDSSELTREQLACIQEVSEHNTKHGTNLKFKLHDKRGSLELLGKYLAMFTDKVQHSGNIAISMGQAARQALKELEAEDG